MKKLVLAIVLLMAGKCCGLGAQIVQDSNAYTIVVPWADADLFEVQFVQSADTMYLVHNDYTPQKLTRAGHTDWALADVDFTGGPFRKANIVEATTITASAKTGDVTLTGSDDIWVAGHVGALWQIHDLLDANTVVNSLATGTSTDTLEVFKGQTFSMTTSGNWWGKIKIERSYDAGATWNDASRLWTWQSAHDGNLDYTDVETENNALYRTTMVTLMSGNVDVTMSTVGGVFGGVVEITAVNGPRSAQATVETDSRLPGTTATWRWSEGAWSTYRGFPGTVALYQERLCYGGSKGDPQTVWLSQTDDWDNFEYEAFDDGALTFTMAAAQVNAIQWLVGHQSLVVGTTGGEWKLDGGTEDVLTFENYDTERQSNYGSAKIQARLVNSDVIYVQHNAEKVRQLRYSLDRDGWISPDMTLLAEHITDGGIVEIDYQRSPQATLWAVRSDGELLGVTLEDSQEVIGWYRYVFDGECESVAVTEGDPEDLVWVVIKRTINGIEKRYLEQLQPVDYADQKAAYYVDCGLTFDGGDAVTITNITQADPMVITAGGHGFTDGEQVRITDVSGMTEVNNTVYTVSTVTSGSFEMRDVSDAVDIDSTGFTAYTSGGSIEQVENTFSTLTHLEGETVSTAGDGGYAGSYLVASGTITLSDFYNVVHAGLPYTAKVQPHRLEFPQSGGLMQGLTKKINAVNVRFHNSLSCSIGPTWTDYDSYVFRRSTDALEAAVPLFSGDKRMLFDGPYDREGRICIQDAFPVPLTVVAIMLDYEVRP